MWPDALKRFEQALDLRPQNEAALLGKAWALLKLKSHQDLSVQAAFLRIPVSIPLSYYEYPAEWVTETCEEVSDAWRNFYVYCQTLYVKNAFEEVLEILSCHLQEVGDKLLFLELKFKCLWKLNKPREVLWECGESLKSHASEENYIIQKLSMVEKQMVQETISWHLCFTMEKERHILDKSA
jgi:hypothetical protein